MSNRRRGYAVYCSDRVTTAGPQQLILLLYERALTALEYAIAHPDQARAELNRAQSIVGELRASLNRKPCPDLAERLDALYLFVQDRIATAQKDSTQEQALRESHEVLNTLLSGWRTAFAQQQPAAA